MDRAKLILRENVPIKGHQPELSWPVKENQNQAAGHAINQGHVMHHPEPFWPGNHKKPNPSSRHEEQPRQLQGRLATIPVRQLEHHREADWREEPDHSGGHEGTRMPGTTITQPERSSWKRSIVSKRDNWKMNIIFEGRIMPKSTMTSFKGLSMTKLCHPRPVSTHSLLTWAKHCNSIWPCVNRWRRTRNCVENR